MQENPVHFVHQLVHIILGIWEAQVVEHEFDLRSS